MKKEKIVELINYREALPPKLENPSPHSISEELVTAIQNLINRLRDADPIPQSG